MNVLYIRIQPTLQVYSIDSLRIDMLIVDLINVDLKNEETEKATRARLMTLVDAYKNEQTAIVCFLRNFTEISRVKTDPIQLLKKKKKKNKKCSP